VLEELYAELVKYCFEVVEMNEDLRPFRLWRREGVFAAVSFGFFFVLVGALFVASPGLYDGVGTFLNSSSWTTYKVSNSNVTLPVLASPGAHVAVYQAAFEFCLVWGLFQIVLLVFRFVVGALPRRKARTASSVVFWLGASFLVSTFLNASTTTDLWIRFWAAVIVLLGISLIIRAAARLAMK
jgi:hypothetical protein